MNAAELIATILWLALAAYAVLAGADFGGGVWDILAHGPRAGDQRRAVAEALGPVWEANHVWLIFLITGLFTAFPSAFGALATALYLPFTIALIGIILRGSAFAFRAHAREAVGPLSTWGVIFGAASIVTPVLLATTAAAVGGGFVVIRGTQLESGYFAGWTTPFAIVLGLFALALCAYLAATYLMVETEDRPELMGDFRRRAAAAGLVSGGLGLLALLTAWLEAPRLFESLTGRGLPLFLLALLNGPLALWAVLKSRPRIARAAVVAQMVLVLAAWVVGQWPFLVPPGVTIEAAAAPAATLTAMVVVIAAGMALLIPSLWLLFRVFKARNPAVDSGNPSTSGQPTIG